MLSCRKRFFNMANIDFKKRFSIGLALDSEADEYERLFAQYGDYIDNLYFSPPLGDRFHGRNKIAEQFRNSEMCDRFWRILKVTQAYKIGLEAVFNTHLLEPGDLAYARTEFDRHQIHLDKVCIQDSYYDEAKRIFPASELVHSVNCMPDEIEKIIEAAGKYEEYVVGRQYTRNSALFKKIREQGSKCVLLLNNGCSHWCGGCSDSQHCSDSYKKSRETYIPQEIYAIQSILPYEIHEKLIDTSAVKLFKLSTRNADVSYITMCLDSYINNSAFEYIKRSTDYYLLWSRLLWIVKDFPTFDYNAIRDFKKNLVKKYE